MSDFARQYVTIDDPIAAFDKVVDVVAGLLASADRADSQPDAAMIPLDWSFETLRYHFVETLEEYTAVAGGRPERAEGSPSPEHRPQSAADFLAAAARARQAFSRPDVITGVLHTQIGPQPGGVVLQHVLNELISHAWDLARAVDRPVTLPSALVEQCRASWQAFFVEFGRPSVNFEPEQPVPADASEMDRLAAYLGRAV
jgi:uncharacterized protein (TIGR03086 family)